MVDRLERIHVVLLELDSPIDQLSDVGVDVGRPEAHLRVIGLVATAAAVDQQRCAVATVEEQMVLDGSQRQLQSDFVLIEAPTRLEIRRDENGRDAVLGDHVRFLLVVV
jgi:hypothetical protein